MASTEAKRLANETINIRIKPQQRAIIDRAAEALGKSRSEFILDTACREAETVLLDRRFFSIDAPAYRRFEEALDHAPADNPQLRKLLRTPAPWEK